MNNNRQSPSPDWVAYQSASGEVIFYKNSVTGEVKWATTLHAVSETWLHVQGSPKCSIVGGDKIEVRGEIGASRRVWGHAPPENCISCIFRALFSGQKESFCFYSRYI